jgi:hypothetical protein
MSEIFKQHVQYIFCNKFSHVSHMSHAPSVMYPVLITFDVVNTITEFLFVVIISVWTKCHYFGPVTCLGFMAPGEK